MPKPTRPPERIKLPGGYSLEAFNNGSIWWLCQDFPNGPRFQLCDFNGADAQAFAAAFSPATQSQALVDVITEREKQRRNWGDEHDDLAHTKNELAYAAVAFGMYPLAKNGEQVDTSYRFKPWADLSFRDPNDLRGHLVIMCAFGLAEIERLDRLAQPASGGGEI